VHPLSLHIGKVLSGICRGALTSLAVLALGLLVTQEWGLLHPLALLMLALNCAVFAGLGVIAGLKVPSLETVGLISNFAITPMAFLGATFFDPESLPKALQAVVYCLPLSHASIGIRAAAYKPISQFPWYTLVVWTGMAIALTLVGAYQFSHQQD
ncbi:MAG: ABC transporter permease, partial [Cyanobacteria bacterium P01_G01_bin.4]